MIITYFLSGQRSEAGGPETEAAVGGGGRPAALPGGGGAGLLWEGKRRKRGSETRPACCTRSCSVSSLFQTVSYAQFLYPTNALARMKSAGAAETGAAQTPQPRFRAGGQRNPASAHPINAAAQEACRPTPNSHASAGVCSLPDSGFSCFRRGGGGGVRSQPAQRPAVALWAPQAGPDICVLHGEGRGFLPPPCLHFVPLFGVFYVAVS